MTSPAKRSLDGTDNRARSPKRRKFGPVSAAAVDRSSSPTAQTSSTSGPSSLNATLEPDSALPEKLSPGDDGWWPARAILKEKGRGSRKQYLIDWEPHPTTGEVFKPSFVCIDPHRLNKPY